MMRASWQYILMAFGISLILWFMVAGQSQVETLVDVRVEFWGMPRDMVIREGMVQRVSVRLSGTRSALRNVNPMDMVYPLDLSDLRQGDNIITLLPGRVVGSRGTNVTEISPARLTLRVDTVESKNVPLNITVSGAAPSWLIVESTDISPQFITVSGPSTLLEEILEIKLDVPFPQDARPGPFAVTPLITLPDEISSVTSRARVSWQLSARMREVTVQREVELRTAPNAPQYAPQDAKIENPQVSLRLNIPAYRESSRVQELLAGVVAYVQLPPDIVGRSQVPVRLELPEYVTLIGASPANVTVLVGE